MLSEYRGGGAGRINKNWLKTEIDLKNKIREKKRRRIQIT